MSLLPQDTELGNLEIIDVYDYYDQPCLFSCKNQLGDIFLAIWSTEDMWLYVPVTENKLKETIQIRDFYLNSENGFVYKVISDGIEKVSCKELIDDWLPIPNEFL